ncbi:MAG: hypothetical protein HY305_04155, partial [Sphingobacteriales bacterium]|nr:hypothetical protein [Sphingobacteriales bacterium]
MAPFPKADIYQPATICFGETAQLHALINIGTVYSWTNADSLNNAGNGYINSVPFDIDATAKQARSTNYVLTIKNDGCPSTLKDTFHVEVIPKFTVEIGRDTSIVVGQPLQLMAHSTDKLNNSFTWQPVINIDNAEIYDPVLIFHEPV